VSQVLAILRREWLGFFATGLGWVFLVVFPAAAGWLAFELGDFYARGLADLQPFFGMHPWLYVVLTPALTMRMWAEEARDGTLELLLTLPVSLAQAMLGKFLAAWLLLGLALVLTFPFWVTVNYLGSPDNGVILAGYLGSWLLAGAFAAIGVGLSAATQSQVAAFIFAALLGLVLVLAGQPQVLDMLKDVLPHRLLNAAVHLSLLHHFEAIARGVLDLRDLCYFLLTIVCALTAGVLALQIRRAG
jgi:ABC-2 type transport system permease protein